MEVKDLEVSLKKQKDNLAVLLSAALQKQKALVSLDYSGLESSITKEERALTGITEHEKQRIKILTDLYSKYSLSFNSYKLAEFMERTRTILDKKSINEIAMAEKELKELITKISKVNQQNKYLIENSRAFIKETISCILNARKSLLDKKV
ncbi:MAG: flagellar export chaperone FlgN [Ignavibacteriales bacterium]